MHATDGEKTLVNESELERSDNLERTLVNASEHEQSRDFERTVINATNNCTAEEKRDGLTVAESIEGVSPFRDVATTVHDMGECMLELPITENLSKMNVTRTLNVKFTGTYFTP